MTNYTEKDYIDDIKTFTHNLCLDHDKVDASEVIKKASIILNNLAQKLDSEIEKEFGMMVATISNDFGVKNLSMRKLKGEQTL